MHVDELGKLLEQLGIDFAVAADQGVAVVELPGVTRLKTTVVISPGVSTVRFEAFVCRHVEEKQAEVYQMLLQKNRRTAGVAYTLDTDGDIYLVGNLPASMTADDLDRVLGSIAERADSDFNKILELGFETSIRKEWEWRLKRGEPTRNLQAFTHLRPDTVDEK